MQDIEAAYEISINAGEGLLEIAKTLQKENAQLRAALEDALSYFNAAHGHDCAGWECVECEPARAASEIYDALAASRENATPAEEK